MKLSNTMETCLVTLLDRKDNHHRSAASKRERTVKALARRGLVAYGDLAYGQSYDVVLTADGIREAERIRAERAGEARRIRAERAGEARRIRAERAGEAEEAPAPLPRRRPGTAIKDAVKRYRTPLAVQDAARFASAEFAETLLRTALRED